MVQMTSGRLPASSTTHNSWNERVLYSFKGGADGLGSIGNLVLAKNGALYGTTSEGGSGCVVAQSSSWFPTAQETGKQEWFIAFKAPQMQPLPTTEW